jgi:hypothetical protein
MIKTSLIALVAVASVSLAALPAFAESSVFGSDQDFGKDGVIAELKADGVNVTSVEEWNGYIRAFVTLEDGSQAQRFFVPGTLEPAAIGGRVATDLAL